MSRATHQAWWGPSPTNPSPLAPPAPRPPTVLRSALLPHLRRSFRSSECSRPPSVAGTVPNKSFAASAASTAASYSLARRYSPPPAPVIPVLRQDWVFLQPRTGGGNSGADASSLYCLGEYQEFKGIAAIPSPTPSWPSSSNFAADAATSAELGRSLSTPSPTSTPGFQQYQDPLKFPQIKQEPLSNVRSEFRSFPCTSSGNDAKVFESGSSSSMANNGNGMTWMNPVCNCPCTVCTSWKLKTKESTPSNCKTYSGSVKRKQDRNTASSLELSMSTEQHEQVRAHGMMPKAEGCDLLPNQSTPNLVYEKRFIGSRYWEFNKPPEHVVFKIQMA